MTIRTLIYLVILLLVVNVAALVTMIYNRVNSEDRPPRFPEAPSAEEGLLPPTEQEVRVIRDARVRFDSTIAPRLAEMREVRETIFEELRADNPDTAKVFAKLTDLGALQSVIQKQLIQRFLDDRDEMRPEQRRRFLKMIEERLENRPMPFRSRMREGFGPKER